MKLTAYMRTRGLIASHVATKLGVTRQYLDQYDAEKRSPTLKTMMRIAAAMTDLGAPTTVADLSRALLMKEEDYGQTEREQKPQDARTRRDRHE